MKICSIQCVNETDRANLRAASSLIACGPVAFTLLYVHCVGITLKEIDRRHNTGVIRTRWCYSRELGLISPYYRVHLDSNTHFSETVYTVFARLAGGNREYHLSSESLRCIRA